VPRIGEANPEVGMHKRPAAHPTTNPSRLVTRQKSVVLLIMVLPSADAATRGFVFRGRTKNACLPAWGSRNARAASMARQGGAPIRYKSCDRLTFARCLPPSDDHSSLRGLDAKSCDEPL